MSSVNKVILIGNLGADPELRQTSGGSAVCELRLATNEQWKDQNGDRKERTEWHRIVVWGRQAESVARFMKKGRSVYVEGRLQTREWTDKENVKRYTTEIIATNVVFLQSGGGGGGGGMDGPPPAGDDDYGSGGGGGGNFGGGGGGGGYGGGGGGGNTGGGGGYGGGGGGGNTGGGGTSGGFDDSDIPF